MGWGRMLAAVTCLTVGTADVVYLDVAVVPAVLGAPSGANPSQPAAPREPFEKVAALAPEPEPAPAPAPESPAAPTPAPAAPAAILVHFDRDSAHLRSDQHAPLRRAIALLHANPARVAVIDGHADSQGEAEHNEDLSRHRADRVADFLAAHDIDRARLIVHAFGESRPLDPAHTDAAFHKNRRVEVHIAVPAADDGGAQ